MTGQAWRDNPWCVYRPGLHPVLADRDGNDAALPRNYAGLDFDHICAWWETLRYLFRALLG